jgi:hypothetical protein
LAVKSLHFLIGSIYEILCSSISYREVLLKLNVKAARGNFSTLHKAIKHFNIDVSHMLGQASNRGKTFSPKRNINEYLIDECPIQSNRLKKDLSKTESK